jgi:hypothetical protein
MMRHSMIPVGTLALVLTIAAGPLAAQEARSGGRGGRNNPILAGPAPRTADGKADLSGVWNTDRPFVVDIAGALKKGETLPIQPWAAKVLKERLSKDDPEALCLPTGVPRLAPYPMKYLQMPQSFVILFEGNIHSWREIHLDRTEHIKDYNPSWYGDSIGHWDGDTLVVDTVGFNDKSWFDFAGHPHTEQLHTVERFRRPDFGHIDYEVDVIDLGAYTKPFTLYGSFPLMLNGEIMEYICSENNRDVSHLTGFDPPTLTDGGRGSNRLDTNAAPKQR